MIPSAAHGRASTYFLTAVSGNRHDDGVLRHLGVLYDVLGEAVRRQSMSIGAYVVLPDHLHLLCTLPRGKDVEGAWQQVIEDFDHRRRGAGPPARGRLRTLARPLGSAREIGRCEARIHLDPVRHGTVRCVLDWPYSSFRARLRERWRQGSAPPAVDDPGLPDRRTGPLVYS